MKVKIETERLLIREVREEDAEGFFQLDSDPEVHKYLGENPIKTLDEARGIIKYIHSQYEKNGIGRLSVLDKNTGEFLGWNGIKLEDGVRKEPYYDLGYRFIKKYWGKGYATESSIACLNYGFKVLYLNTIEAGAHVDNYGSNNVLKKLGFKYIEEFEFENEMHNWYRLDNE